MRAIVSGSPRTRRAVWLAAGLCALATVGQLLLLRKLDYSRASLGTVPLESALSPADTLALGGLSWHPEPYTSATSLAPIRAAVRQHCPDRAGYDLAICLSNLFADRFAHGMPKQEFFARNHDPVAVFRAHMAGEPGHCVSRSGMLAIALLASGTPARVVQLLGRDGTRGHNVAEIWDQAKGWQVLDPSFAGQLESSDGRTSAVALTVAPFPRWLDQPARAKVTGIDQTAAKQEYERDRLRHALIIYPEPWLYTRVGASKAPWPFQARFVIVGSSTLSVGLGQTLLQVGILITGIIGALIAAFQVGQLAAAKARAIRDRRAPEAAGARVQSTS